MDIDIVKRFKEYEENPPLKWDDIENKYSQRPDLHAMIMLDLKFPFDGSSVLDICDCNMIYDRSGHLVIDIDKEQWRSLTDTDVAELVACGVSYDSHTDSLVFF